MQFQGKKHVLQSVVMSHKPVFTIDYDIFPSEPTYIVEVVKFLINEKKVGQLMYMDRIFTF